MKALDTAVERLESLCRERNLSYYALSYKSAVPMSTIINIMTKKSKNPGLVTISKLCDGLDITIREFFDTEAFAHLEQEIE